MNHRAGNVIASRNGIYMLLTRGNLVGVSCIKMISIPGAASFIINAARKRGTRRDNGGQ